MYIVTLSQKSSTYPRFAHNNYIINVYQENVSDSMVWFPVSLESVDTNGAIASHIGVEYLGQEIAWKYMYMYNIISARK